jgi:hypothetical protein
MVKVECSVCDAEEEVFGEITEKTLEDEGWYLGAFDLSNSALCPDHNEETEE